jgi:hypothetical protein
VTDDPGRRPSREQLRGRIELMKRGIVILAAGSFGAIALLAAGRTAAGNAQRTTPVQQAQAQNQSQGDEGDDGYFSYTPPQTPDGGTLGGGSAAGPPAAGTHAS